ncbi:Sjogren syndrome/scleroderma autoantigen 1 (Autoantigen p27) [Natrinema hispanicum]|uniref:Sjogren syndrome/scleroderma autoantigen 1 (Autoantigen p27) n=1 Tax=Natrinema hispanicum TaxID=392421 RepID=A0A482YCJ6_9EURY|nr:Sjogren's syndrome/scleroderma autoantigen 1 family protein [Natrinema hispanicum]RZV11947.1 Sjogren syndrome/scleroderma autoantigen 1 (Autoantigen p27) [Natrinema hispanicum]
MSDFDKEAEREKLREKYERDKQERKATQRMSDLLLKGATMTNTHCGTCGDPLFQMDGTTFCPSCHGNPDAVEGTDLEAQPADEQPSTDQSESDQSAADESTPAAPSEPTAAATSDASTAETDVNNQRESSVTTPSRDERQPTPQADVESSQTDVSSRTADNRASEPGASSRSPVPTQRQQPADGDLEAAHNALVRTLEKFATEAAATDDPRYARECLEAAREAGETLSTLR